MDYISTHLFVGCEAWKEEEEEEEEVDFAWLLQYDFGSFVWIRSCFSFISTKERSLTIVL